MMFRNFYRCARCGHEWTDLWSATCDDDCPHCGARHMSPQRSEELDQRSEDASDRRPAEMDER
jgi:DNA-directed RNA polymerase subunit RPC12/RpoP